MAPEPDPPTTSGPDAPVGETPPEEPAAPPAPKRHVTTAQPIATLLRVNLRGWFSAKGFWLVLAAALIPPLLVGSWVLTHRADVSTTDIAWEPQEVVVGEPVNFTATVTNVGDRRVGDFNVTMRVGYGAQNPDGSINFRPSLENTSAVQGLDPGERATVRMTWTPVVDPFGRQEFGTFIVLADADVEDVLGEIEEFNNQGREVFQVQLGSIGQGNYPTPQGAQGNQSAASRPNVSVELLGWTPRDLEPGTAVTFRARVTNEGAEPLRNGTFQLRLARYGGAAPGATVVAEEETVDLAAGQSREIELAWPSAENGLFVVDTTLRVGADQFDPDGDDNYASQILVVDRPILFPDPPERATVKAFYLQVLDLLHLRLLIPLVALFYAAGIVTDERNRGTLPYLLTRPVPRWLLPTTKFVASFLVAAAAIALGLVVAFFVLFRTPANDPAYLTTPLIASLVALFVYGAVFAWLGVVAERPYLVGLAFILGWETIAGNFVPWVERMTLTYHLSRGLNGYRFWDLLDPQHSVVEWLPAEAKAARALWTILLVGLGFLVAAAVAMKRKEFTDL